MKRIVYDMHYELCRQRRNNRTSFYFEYIFGILLVDKILLFTIWTIHFIHFSFCQVLGSSSEFHFVHRALPHARTKRSISHTRQLKSDPQVSSSHSKHSNTITS